MKLTKDMPVRPSWEFARELKRGRRIPHVVTLDVGMFHGAHDRQCRENHSDQDLERLRERGGLSAREALAILTCSPFEDYRGVSEETAMRALYSMQSIYRGGVLAGRSALQEGEG
jgi:sulfur relay (sulfurtransferase) complex TusBCD TusD component (DsrE family)